MESKTFIINQSDGASRLDVFIAEKTGMTRNAAQRLIEDGYVTVSGRQAKKNRALSTGDEIEITERPVCDSDFKAERIPLDIIYEDADLLVVNKQKGMVVHPAAGHNEGTLVNALLAHCKNELSGINGVARPGIVHRIDKDTSGLLIVAKNDFAHVGLAKQIAAHSFIREYSAVVHGSMPDDSGVIEKPIARHPVDRKRMAVVAGGKEAYTAYEVVARYNGFTHISCRLGTGRTHQIRVHLSSIGHPVAGDAVYNAGAARKVGFPGLSGQCLHAGRIAFTHPRDARGMDFQAPLPGYFLEVLTKLEKL